MVSSLAVIGGGIVGTASAEWARRSGLQVTLIDRLAAGDEAMTSYGNAGILASSAVIPVTTSNLIKQLPFYLFSKKSPLLFNWLDLPRLSGWLLSYLRHAKPSEVERIAENLSFLLHDSVEQHFALARGTEAEAFLRHSDYYNLFRSEGDFRSDENSWALRKSHGFDWQTLDRKALSALDNHVGDFYNFAVRLPGHGYVVDPGGYVAALQSHFSTHGGMIERADISDIRVVGDKVEIVGEGYVADFDKCVIAGGIHSDVLARRLGIRSAIRRESGYHIFLRSPSFMPPAPFFLNVGKCVLTPMQDGLRLSGLVEFGGGERVSQRAIDFLLDCLRRAYPSLEYDDYRVWRGHRPSTPDSLPLMGAHPNHNNIFFACGHQHIGLTASAKTGRLISQMITGENLNHDLSDFDPGRFS